MAAGRSWPEVSVGSRVFLAMGSSSTIRMRFRWRMALLVWSVLGAGARAEDCLQGLLAVEERQGAALAWFPLGPGIGNGGLGYVPGLEGRFAPWTGVVPAPAGSEGVPGPGLLATGGFQLSPGSLDLRLSVCGSYTRAAASRSHTL